MSLPSPSTSIASGVRGVGRNVPFEMSAKDQDVWDSPLVALAQRSKGDLRLLLYSLFSFLHRKTDFYMVPSDGNGDGTVDESGIDAVRKMGFKEGDAEKLLLAAFRQFPLRRVSSNSNSNSSTSSSPDPAPALNTNDTKPHKPQQQQQQQQQQVTPTSATKKKEPVIKSKPKPSNESSSIRLSEDNKQIPVGNGGSSPLHGYKWTQTIHEISIAIPLPTDTRAKHLNVTIKPTKLHVSFKNQNNNNNDTPHLLQGQLSETIRTDESTWTIEGDVLLITLDKLQKTWWDTPLQGHEPIDTELIDSKRNIAEYDDATQGMIRKILFDQRQERLGLPNSEQLLAQDSPLLKEANDIIQK
eukprot:CAMPEP_0198251410 /NCGR_PEP_ID=MMETSP1447-20131203/2251_1 /TAXON_ID=420782 /ORGANISM="Chaetoceros dichaeta, Strain CCMP1751" /LENGTH=355 /DNA_ID=CAMNT_0043936423 /DNA_START=26 /DNA_END=1090 /DNA_ORIENTATION=+